MKETVMAKVVTLLLMCLHLSLLNESEAANIDETVQSIRDRFEKVPSQQDQRKDFNATSIVRVLENELTAETDAIVRGFKEMTGQIDRDFRTSGEEEMKNLMQVLKSHSNELRKRFSEMSESINRNVHDMMKGSESLAASDDNTSGFMQYLHKLG